MAYMSLSYFSEFYPKIQQKNNFRFDGKRHNLKPEIKICIQYLHRAWKSKIGTCKPFFAKMYGFTPIGRQSSKMSLFGGE